MRKDRPEGYYTMMEIAQYAHVTKQAVYLAIKKGYVKHRKIGRNIFLRQEDYDAYRAEKYNKDRRMRNGVPLFDMDKGTFSVSQVSRIMSASLGRPYDVQRIYHLCRKGVIKSLRNGPAWIIPKEEAEALLRKEQKGEMLYG